MGYCTQADIETLLQQTLDNTNSKPSSAQVAALILQVSAEIDMAFISIGLTAPVTDANLLKTVQLNSAYGVAGICGFTYGKNWESIDNSQAGKYWQIYKDFLQSITTQPQKYANGTGQAILNIASNYTDGLTEAQDLIKNTYEY